MSRSIDAVSGGSDGSPTPVSRLAWLPIPAFLALFGALAWLGRGASFEPPYLLPTLNILLITGVCVPVALLAARSYINGESASVLLLGCGSLAIGVASAISGLSIVTMPWSDVAVTVYNVGVLLAGGCHVATAVLALRPAPPSHASSGRMAVAIAYATVVVFLAVVVAADLDGVVPDFFVGGGGPTVIRQTVLSSAIAMFTLAAVVFLAARGRAPSRFIDWYMLSLLLMGVGLLGVLVAPAVGSPLGWAGRAAQYVASLYLLAAVLSVEAEGPWRIPLDQMLRETRERHESLVDLCPDAILVHADGKYVLANPAAARLFGASSARDLIGRTVLDLIHPDFRDQVDGRIRRALAGQPAALQHLRCLRVDGSSVECEAAAALVEFGGRPAIQVVMRDVTERYRLHESLQEQATRLEEANRLKDQFLATLSHELRTPLNAILGWSQMLVQGHLDPVTRQHALEAIDRNARSQVHLINDVLDVSRIVSGKLRLTIERVDVNQCLGNAIDAVRPAAAAKQILITQRLDPDMVVSGDADRLQQVLWNLLSNAVKFTPVGGRVDVRMQRTDGALVITVRDSGIGIGPEALQHMFERFWQADGSTTRQHGGLGLGLAIVRHLVELHGGHAMAQSDGPWCGATFTVSLPPAPADQPAASNAAASVEYATIPSKTAVESLTGVRVLVVDDEPDARELLQEILRHAGAEARVVATAPDGVAEIQRWRPDVLVSDIGMPDEDGYDLIRRVRALPSDQGGGTPAVALTAYGRPRDRTAALTAGFEEHLSKPVMPEQFLATVAGMVRRAGSAPRS